MSRRILAGLVLALALTASSSASAQVGGFIKKKVKDKAAEAAGVQPQQQSADQPARIYEAEVTPAVLDRMIKAMKAEKTARDNWEAGEEKRRKAKQERDKQEALARMDPQTRHQMCVSDSLQADPEYPKIKKLSDDAAAAQNKGDQSAAMQIAMQMAPIQAGLQQRAEAACTAAEKKNAGKKPSAEQRAIQEAPPNSPEDAGAAAGGFSATDYGSLKELLITCIEGRPMCGGLKEPEAEAVKAKKSQLKDGLKAIGRM